MAIEDKKESKSVEEKDEGLEKAFGSADNVEKDTIDVVDQASKIDDDFEVNVKAPMKEDMNEFTEIHHEEKSDVDSNEEVVECQESVEVVEDIVGHDVENSFQKAEEKGESELESKSEILEEKSQNEIGSEGNDV